MRILEQQYQNEFLMKWIYGELTPKELHEFVTSASYKKLVYSQSPKRESKKDSL